MSSNRFRVEKSTDELKANDNLLSSPSKKTQVHPEEISSIETYEDPTFNNNPTSAGQKALFEEEEEGQVPFVSNMIRRLAYHHSLDEGTGGEEAKQRRCGWCCCCRWVIKPQKRKHKKKKLGTLLGVYFPCIQNILGVILFIRMVWVVGMAGWLQSFIIVLICCCCTMITAISMSAIATNGVVSSGGAYFMISRNLGPEFGGAVGILFYLGTTVASSMYIVGAIEILVQYMAPSMCFFGPVTESSHANNSYRLYGTLLLITMVTCVFIGVKFVSKLSPIALLCVLGSILAIYIGIFVANPSRGPRVCFVGDILIASEKIQNATTKELDCSKDENGTIYKLYCPQPPLLPIAGVFDYCSYLNQSKVELKPGIPGFTSGVFMKNMGNEYSDSGIRIGSQEKGDRSKGDIITDISTSFVILIGIFFPSVTGIMAGSNRSGDLENAQKSIPTGTIAAVGTTSFIYLSTLLLFAATVEGQVLRDKFGESIGGGLVVAHLAWPNPWVIMVGSFFSTCGAGLQCLVGAPRLLQAIARDGIIPFLKVFEVTSKSGEPVRALLLTALIAESGVLLANVDYIAPVITMFFLMCYCFTNLACVVQTILKTPNWRPRFKYYHWTLSLFGVFLSLGLMFVTSWYYALCAIGVAFTLYKYIEYKGAEKEWGDGLTGLSMSAARFALLRLEDNRDHAKNWRPQLLVLCKLDQATNLPFHPNLIDFASQLKAGKGLLIVSSVVRGNTDKDYKRAAEAKEKLVTLLKATKAKGFVSVYVALDVAGCISYVIQGAGLGSLKHNSVLAAFPVNWRTDEKSCQMFFNSLRTMDNKDLAVLIAKGIDDFPNQTTPAMGGFIDVWWIVHDGGLLMLLPFLLMQHKVWKRCRMRIFTVAEIEDNSIQMKKDIEKFVYDLRMVAEVQVIEIQSTDISAYTYERTIIMETRNTVWKKIQAHNVFVNPQLIMDSNRRVAGTDLEALKEEDNQRDSQFTFSPSTLNVMGKKATSRPKSRNVRRMHSAVNLNMLMKQKSSQAQLIFLNLPAFPKAGTGETNYMEYVEVLTEGLKRALMVKGSNKEVITIYS